MIGRPDPAPDFLVLGGQRCGSTWTQECLMAHPDIFVPRRRRGIQFDTEQLAPYGGQPVAGIVNSTLLTEPAAAEAIAAIGREIRLVAILRNPIDRAHSWYLKRRRDGDEIYAQEISFEAALDLDPMLVEGGLYHEGLSRYFEHFATDQVLVLDYDRLARDPATFIREIYAFVGVEPVFEPPQLAGRSNYSAQVRSGAIHQAMRKGKRVLWRVSGENGPLMSRIESSALVGRLRRLNERSTATMSVETRDRLTGVFAAPNAALADLLGWDLRHWE